MYNHRAIRRNDPMFPVPPREWYGQHSVHVANKFISSTYSSVVYARAGSHVGVATQYHI